MQLSSSPSPAPSAAFPALFGDRGSEALEGTGEAVIKLLRDGLNALADDRIAGVACIQRACALLESECERPLRPPADIVRGGLAKWQVRRAVAYIDQNLERSITTFDLSPTVNLSPHYFARAFKQTFGVTPNSYIYSRRMDQAQQLMLTTDEPLSQIAMSCGYADQAHFTRRFRQSTGATPHAWRRAHLGSYHAAP